MTPRSLALNAVLYVSLVLYMLLALPSFVLPRSALMAYVRGWGHYFVWICRVIGGIGLEVRGRENIPPGPLLVASKHQSIWETFALIGLFDDPCFILKQELTWIPLFGWYAMKARMLPVDRRGGSGVLRQLNERARSEIRRGAGRQLLIFPEGTRRAAGAPPAYRHGVVHMYEKLGVPCLPVALNSGLFWPRRSLKHRQGTVLVEILPPLPPAMPRDAFASELQQRIEEASDRLLAEGLKELGANAPAIPAPG
ncbi:lysophospholipid acyltransferase family protein [Alsobacter soli]|uniref:lysophospholipid acyltransferase family protein n=1 Tax=Alsobacter soli TaxID=2109933 RepID=UPI0018AD5B13|nr:lysophospholipid acyltransferase family protein [Alsobacter soli]